MSVEVETAEDGAVVVPAETEQTEKGSEATTEQSEIQKAEQPRDEKGKFVPQERVNEITKARRDAERRADGLERELAMIRQQSVQHQPQSEQAPTFEQSGYDPVAFQRAMTTYVAKQTEAAVDRRWQEQEVQRNRQQAATGFYEKSREYAKTHSDYDGDLASLDSSVRFRDEVMEAITLSPQGPEVAHYLAKHLDEADRIARLPPHLAAVQLGRIEVQVSTTKPKPVSNAPSPVSTVGGGSRASQDVNDPQLSQAAWLKLRRAQL